MKASEEMKILAMDIGMGTRDILLYDSEKRLENCTRMVLPSPTRLLASRIDGLQTEGGELFITGRTVGGGPFSLAIKRRLARGERVFMTREAAYTVRNNLEEVASLGITVVDGMPDGFKGTVVSVDELNLSQLASFLAAAGEDVVALDGAAVAVQDHGAYRSGDSNRKTRLAHMRRRLEEKPDPRALSYLSGEVPETFPRMASAARQLEEQLDCPHLLVMDTAPAAIAGCLSDRGVAERAKGTLLLVNAGNGHTMACLLRRGRVAGLLEHHTAQLEPHEFASYLQAFCDGRARDDDPYMASGHGLFYLDEQPGWEALDLIAVTGPNRELLEPAGLDIYYPAPGGDMMMTGPMGLVSTLLYRTGLRPPG
jgi:uncharacterized protein (DUF1786 family)